MSMQLINHKHQVNANIICLSLILVHCVETVSKNTAKS